MVVAPSAGSGIGLDSNTHVSSSGSPMGRFASLICLFILSCQLSVISRQFRVQAEKLAIILSWIVIAIN